MNKYIVIKTVKNRWTYYLGKHNRWEGLRSNAVLFNYEDVSPIIDNLIIDFPKDKFSYIDANTDINNDELTVEHKSGYKYPYGKSM